MDISFESYDIQSFLSDAYYNIVLIIIQTFRVEFDYCISLKCHKPSYGYRRSARFILAEICITYRTISKCFVENQRQVNMRYLALNKSDI